VRGAVAALLGVIAVAPASAQFWVVRPTSTVDLPTTADVDCDCPIPPALCVSTDSATSVPGFLGSDQAWWSDSACIPGITSPCGCRSRGNALVRVDGIGSGILRIRYDAVAWANHDCVAWSRHGPCDCPSSYNSGASAVIDVDLNLAVQGLPPGTPVTIFFNWWQWSGNMYRPEAVADDTSQIVGGTMSVGGAVQFAGDYDLDNIRGILFEPGISGSFGTVAGATITVTSDVTLNVRITPPPRGTLDPCVEYDSESVAWGGEITLGINGPPPPPRRELAEACDDPDAVCAGPPVVEFSVDIGGDRELSDPLPDPFDNEFDPGDMYEWLGAPLPFGGADGIRDDAVIVAIDPFPDPPDGPPAGSAAPTCSGASPIGVTPMWFDVDGSDSLAFVLADFIPPFSPAPGPIERCSLPLSPCIHRAEHLLISYDDDGPTHYVGTPFGLCETPVNSSSPTGLTYGTTAGEDEIIGLLLLALPTGAATGAYSVVDEETLHPSLAPNPVDMFGFAPEDDDVDALDVTDGVSCPFWYLSVDHEATGDFLFAIGVDPGDIYFVGPGLLMPAVDDVMHLGLSDDVDLDAFEFVWTLDPSGGDFLVLTLLFSVDDDDALTPGDESGGLDPAMIYASYLTGFSFPFLGMPLSDDVDAIAAWCAPVQPPAPCVGDLNGDGSVNLADLAIVLSNYGLTGGATYADGDLDGDGDVDLADLAMMLAVYGASCP